MPSSWYARTVEIDDPGPLSSFVPDDAAAGCAWIRRGDGMVGLGRALTYHPSCIADGEAWWRATVSGLQPDPHPTAGPGPVAFGTFVFDPDHTAARSTMIIPELIIRRQAGRGWLTAVSDHPVITTPQLPTPTQSSVQPSISYADGALSGLQWESAVATAVELIKNPTTSREHGPFRLDKVVLARDLWAVADRPIQLRRVVGNLARDYAPCWTFAIDGLVGATPEMLVRREGGLATSRVLAGTIRRTGDHVHDLALAAALSQSSKDLEEHEYAVRSVAEALAPYCSGMNVPDAPYVLELPNVLHLATDVTAVAHEEVSSLAMAGALHPSAAICGTPTETARRTIAALEKLDRERYSGPVGWVDASGDGEWGIALRCGQLDGEDPQQLRLFAGCGIVAGSDPQAELAESAAKLVPMRDALAG